MSNKNLQLGNVSISEDGPTIIIAEAAVEHLGNLNVAMRMAEAAKEVGVDVIKYQMHLPSEEMLPGKIKFWGGSLDEILENYNLSTDDHQKLIEHCDKIGIQYLCTPFCPKAVEVLDELGVAGFKTGSGELTNLKLMENIAKTGKTAIISTGMSTEDEILKTVNFLKERNSPFMITNCTSIYPAPYSSINLRLIQKFREKFGIIVGHSDHTPDMWTAIGASAMGAKVIEKHFTLNRFMDGPDAAVSLEPNEFKEMIKAIRIIDEAKGSDEKVVLESEKQVRDWAHHSVVSIVDIPANTVITEDMLSVKRPGTGIPAAELATLTNNYKTNKAIAKDSILEWSDISKS